MPWVKCGLLQLTSWRRLIPSHTTQFGTPLNSKLAVSSMSTSTSWKDYKNQKATVMTMFALQHCSADGLERRPSTLAKEKENGYLARRQRPRLPHEYALCSQCALVCILKTATPKNAVRIQEKHRKSGTQNPSRKDENSWQPKLEQWTRNRDWQHRSWNIIKKRKYNIFWPDDYIPATGDDRDQESY